MIKSMRNNLINSKDKKTIAALRNMGKSNFETADFLEIV